MVEFAPKRFLAELALAGAIGVFVSTANANDDITVTTSMAEFGEPLYKDGFEHWPYANPDAPKGGKIVLGSFGSFDSFNTIIEKGEFPSSSIGLIYDSLMTSSGLTGAGSPIAGDELLSAYAQIAENAEFPSDKSWIIFNLRPEARYSDGVPITADDFCYDLEMLKEHGRPLVRAFYDDIATCEVLSDHRVKYGFKTKDNMKPLMLAAGFSPLPRHFWEKVGVDKTTLEIPPSSGAYEITNVDPGRSITYRRVEDYWGKDLPVNIGLGNFDEMRYEYYKDETVMFEAFKAGEIDFRGEGSAKRWVTEYDFDAVDRGDVIKEEFKNEMPRGLYAFFFNLKRPQFEDIRVRKAINYLYDFEAVQKTLLYGEYTRVDSFFPNSEYGASGPPTPEEVAVLQPFEADLPAEVMTEEFILPTTDGSGRIRGNLRKALALFKEAGYALKDNKLVKDGKQLSLEIVTASQETERLTLPFIKNLRQAGIDASLRIMDVAQWRSRIEQKDFDMYAAGNNFFPPPGTELRIYFGSEVEGDPGRGNRIGYSNPVADTLIEQIVAAKDLETLQVTTRALDRVVLWNYNVVPLYYNDKGWAAYWNKFARPERKPKYATGFRETWWIDPDLEKNLAAR